MPKMDGIEMAKKIKEANPAAQIVFLTNIKDSAYTDRMEAEGFDYLIKSELRISDIVEKAKKKLGETITIHPPIR